MGAFAACMDGLLAVDGAAVIAERLAAGKPVLAICVGHQVLFDNGIEHGAGGRRLRDLARHGRATARRAAAPHGLEHRRAGRRAAACSPGSRPSGSTSSTPTASASWPTVDGRLVTWAEHGGDRFVAAVEQGPLWSTQFHPEKSGAAGGRLIANWVATLR